MARRMTGGGASSRPGSVTFGLSLDREMAERIGALTGLAHKPQERSKVLREVIACGMAAMFGPDWMERADAIRREAA